MNAHDLSRPDAETIEHWPCPWNAVLNDWLGEIAFRIPPQFPKRPVFLGLISSHSERDGFMQPGWQQALESALSLAKKSHAIPLFASGTPYCERLRHACHRFDMPFAELTAIDSSETSCLDDSCIHLLVNRSQIGKHPKFPGTRVEDIAVTILAQLLFALKLRPSGKLMSLVRARLSEPAVQAGSTLIAVQTQTQPSRMAPEARLADLGAVLWMVSPLATWISPIHPRWGCTQRTVPNTSVPTVPFPPALSIPGEYLIHCTRSRHGAWPDQSLSDYMDEAIRFAWITEPTAVETLARILNQQRLTASCRLKRGDQPTVSFSARGLRDLLALRTFQSHLGRWDWEPFGIAIRRAWLERRGAKPVRYLPPKEIDQLPDSERIFAQPAPMKAEDRDWRVEQEWRIVEDLRLHEIPFHEALLFVPTRSHAAALSSFSRWPIAVLEWPSVQGA